MVRLPEQDNEGMETAETDRTAGGKHRFTAGFVLGILTTLVCVTVFSVGWLAAQRRGVRDAQTASDEADAEVLTDAGTLYKLNEVQSLIEQHYLKEVDSKRLSSYLFKGIAAGLNDPYANYYSAEELQEVLDSSRGEYFGIGATLTVDPKTKEIRVLEVYDEGPAERAGLKAGDLLRAVDGDPVTGVGLSEVISEIKSRDGPFTLQVYRSDTERTLDLSMECDEVELDYVQSEMLEHRIGYIRLSEFTQRAVDQFQDAARELQEQGMEKLIVDLRSNPGGLLDAVCDILDEILPEGMIVYTEDRSGNREEYLADDKRSVTCEVAVLVDGNSASASEIFAGAVQDRKIGPVIGAKTYGKGVVQQTYTLSDGSAFKLTTETYYTPAGQDIDGNGITPDIIIEETDEKQGDPVLDKAVEVLLR